MSDLKAKPLPPPPPYVKWRNSVKARVKGVLVALNRGPVYMESFYERRFLQEIVLMTCKEDYNAIVCEASCVRWKNSTKIPISTILYTMDRYFDLINEIAKPITTTSDYYIAAIWLHDHDRSSNTMTFIKYCSTAFIDDAITNGYNNTLEFCDDQILFSLGSEQCLQMLFPNLISSSSSRTCPLLQKMRSKNG